MHGRRTALRYSPSTPSPAGARSRGQSTVLPFGSGWSAPSPSWRVPGGWREVRAACVAACNQRLKVPGTSVLCYLRYVCSWPSSAARCRLQPGPREAAAA
jgi:hypothetical protein